MEEIKFNKIEGTMDGAIFSFDHFYKDLYMFHMQIDDREKGKSISVIFMTEQELNSFIAKLQKIKEIAEVSVLINS